MVLQFNQIGLTIWMLKVIFLFKISFSYVALYDVNNLNTKVIYFITKKIVVCKRFKKMLFQEIMYETRLSSPFNN